MLLGTQQKLAELIVHCFRLTPLLTEADIYAHVQKVRHVTHRAIFKELAKLLEHGVLVRVNSKYAVKVTWILELLQLGDDLTQQSLNHRSLDLQVPKSGGYLQWRFRNVRRMDLFWVQLMFVLFSVSKSKLMYVWCPHFWFHLLDLRKEWQAMRAMRKGGNRHCLIIGSDSYIDRLPARYWDKRVYEWSYAPGPFAGDTRHYLQVIDDFVITALFPIDFVRQLDALCHNIKNDRELSRANLGVLFDEGHLVTLKVENNPTKAHRLRRKFQRYFGHTPKSP